jgi:cysteine desulfurase
MHIYLDNAASTALDKEVLDTMLPYLESYIGNPSSIHAQGREARSAIEKARKSVANLLNVSPSEIFFTSGGTEADNLAIISGIRSLGIKHALTSPIEHHAVLHSLEYLRKNGEIELSLVDLDENGQLIPESLEKHLQKNKNTFVSLMHGNNEIGNLNDLFTISELCRKYNAVFHSDTVQTVGNYIHDLQKLDIDFIVGSAHKFHGPKGVGFIYINSRNKIAPLIHGGAQERNIRGGTENLYGIVGLAKALEISYRDMQKNREHILVLKKELITRLKNELPGIIFNGNSADLEKSLYTVLNISTPKHEINEMLLFNMDINKNSVSGGSACASGSDIGSHVLRFLNADHERGHVRFSFCKYNTVAEVHLVVDTLKRLFQ